MTIARRNSPKIEVNWRSPLAEGLQFLIVPFGGGMVDLVSGTFGDAQGAAGGFQPVAGPVGDVIGSQLASSTSDSWTWEQDDRYQIIQDLTLFWAGVIDTGSAYRHLASNHASSGGTANPFSAYGDNSANPLFAVVRSDASAFRTWTSNVAFSLAVYQSAFFSQTTSLVTTPLGYVNGSAVTMTGSGGTPAAWATASADKLRVGRRADGAVTMNGTTHIVAGWNIARDAQDGIALHTEWPTLIRRVRRSWDVPAAAAGGTFQRITGDRFALAGRGGLAG